MNSESFVDNLLRLWHGMGGATTTLLRITVIVIAAWVLMAVLQRLLRRVRERLASRMDDPEARKRAETLGRVFRYLIAVVVSLVAGMLVLGELGVSVAPILGAAGVVGLAVGFGAQSLVKDYFSGLFLLLEDQVRTGDIVKLSADHAGFVEEVTLRYVRLRDYDGNVHFVPAGQITSVVNLTREFSQAVVDVRVAYRENVDRVIDVIRHVAAGLRADPDFSERILDELEMAGVDAWQDSGLVVRCRFKVRPIQQWNVKREFLRRLKAEFDRRGIEIPVPHLRLYAGPTQGPAESPEALALTLKAAAQS